MSKQISDYRKVEGEVVIVIDDDEIYRDTFSDILGRLGYVVFGFSNHEDMARVDGFSEHTKLGESLRGGNLVAICIDGNQELKSTRLDMLRDGIDTVIYLRKRFDELDLSEVKRPKLISNSSSGRTIEGTDATNDGSTIGILEILQSSE